MRLTSFLIVNKISDDNAFHAFHSVIGTETYGLLKLLPAPAVPSTKPLNDLKQLLQDHLSPKVFILGDRATFHRRHQLANGSLTQYVALFRNLAETCEFGSFLDESLRDRFVCGLLSADIQRHLLAEGKTLMFSKAVEGSLALDSATKNAKASQSKGNADSDLYKVASNSTSRPKETNACYRSGSSKHLADSCTNISDNCSNCGKKGTCDECAEAKRRTKSLA